MSSAESPEVEIEVVKGKGKDKEKEGVNLEELVDVKGWKSVGNRLSAHKVTKVVSLDETESPEASEDEADSEAPDPDIDRGSKKKDEPETIIEPDGQTALFQPPLPPKNEKPPRPKREDQAELFEAPPKEKPAEEKEVSENKSKDRGEDGQADGFAPGQTVEWNF
jgi:topoisomerase-4 subunit A